MKRVIFLLSVFLPLCFSSLNSNSQVRYNEEITDSARVESYTYAFKDGKSLDMDVYFPAFDNQSNDP